MKLNENETITFMVKETLLVNVLNLSVMCVIRNKDPEFSDFVMDILSLVSAFIALKLAYEAS